jgi:hypothetical protein
MNLNFIEAVTALRNGECEGVRRHGWGNYFGADFKWRSGGDKGSFAGGYFSDTFVDDWELVNPIPATEEVEELWYRHKNGFIMAPSMGRNLADWTLVKVTYSRPVKRKEKKRVEITEISFGNGIHIRCAPESGVPVSAKFFAEWEE